MFNPNYLQGQLRMAADCIRRAMDALASDQAAADPDPAAPPQAQPSTRPAQRAADPTTRLLLLEGAVKAYGERAEQLARILLDIAPDACARHDLFGF